MKRVELEHAIRAASQIIQTERVIVIGSQSILGTWSEGELPEVATLSPEVDILPLSDDDTESLARKLDAIGEMSHFHETHGFYIDGVGRSTAVLPDGWEDRLVEVPATSLQGVRLLGLCLEPHDLCIAKLVAHRVKDRVFVGALIDEGFVSVEVLLERLTSTVPPNGRNLDYAYAWLLDRVTDKDTSPSEQPI